MGLGEVHLFVPLDAEELDTEGLQKQEEEEEELGILQYLDQLEQVTARFLSRLVLWYSHKVKWKETFSFSLVFLVISKSNGPARVDIFCTIQNIFIMGISK